MQFANTAWKVEIDNLRREMRQPKLNASTKACSSNDSKSPTQIKLCFFHARFGAKNGRTAVRLSRDQLKKLKSRHWLLIFHQKTAHQIEKQTIYKKWHRHQNIRGKNCYRLLCPTQTHGVRVSHCWLHLTNYWSQFSTRVWSNHWQSHKTSNGLFWLRVRIVRGQ